MNKSRRGLSWSGAVFSGLLSLALSCAGSGCNKSNRTVPPDPGGLPPQPAAGQGTPSAPADTSALVHPLSNGEEAQAMPPGHPPVLQPAGAQQEGQPGTAPV